MAWLDVECDSVADKRVLASELERTGYVVDRGTSNGTRLSANAPRGAINRAIDRLEIVARIVQPGDEVMSGKKIPRKAPKKAWANLARYYEREGNQRRANAAWRKAGKPQMVQSVYERTNPLFGLNTEEWVLIGTATAVVGIVAYAIYEVEEASQEAQDAASGASDAAGSAADQVNQNALDIQQQLAAVQQAAAAAQSQIQSAQTQAAPTTGLIQGIQNWWNSW